MKNIICIVKLDNLRAFNLYKTEIFLKFENYSCDKLHFSSYIVTSISKSKRMNCLIKMKDVILMG